MKRILFIIPLFALFVTGSAEAFSVKDSEGNKITVTPLGVKVTTSGGDEVKVDATGVSVTSEDAVVGSKTGARLASEHKIAVEARRSKMDFSEIEVSKAIRLTVEERTSGNIIVRAPYSVMPYVSLKVANGTLYATILSGVPVPHNSNVIAEVYIPNNGRIKDISTSASARVVVLPTLSCGDLDLEASSASVIEVKAIANDISIDASGASNIKADISARELDVDASGASVVTLSGVIAEAEVDISGASTLQASTLQALMLDVECSGASKAVVKADICSAYASGASAVSVECAKELNASAGGASKILYDGDCRVNIKSNSGASTIRKK